MATQHRSVSSETRLNILILHGVHDFARERWTTVRHVRAFQRHTIGHRFAYQYVGHPVSESLKAIPWDVVLLDSTFLGWRWVRPRSILERIRRDYAWLKDSGAFLIALPQDDCDHSAILDHWMAEYAVDLLYTVYPDKRNVLYPLLSGRNTRIIGALPGYIDDEDIELYHRFRRPFRERAKDVVYRVRRLQFCGRFGIIKSEFGRRFAEAAKSRAAIDISDAAADTILGKEWPRFLGDSRFALGSESGSSLLDREGMIRDRIFAYVAESPNSDIEEIAAACYSQADEAHVFSVVSPRIFEIAMAGCCPILVRSRFNDLIKPEEHYIPVSPDFHDIDAAVERLQDHNEAQRIVRRLEETIVDNPSLRYGHWVNSTMTMVIDGLSGRKPLGQLSDSEFVVRLQEHNDFVRCHELQSHEKLVSSYITEIERLNKALETVRSERSPALSKAVRLGRRLLDRLI